MRSPLSQRAIAILLLTLCRPALAGAQAWLPEAGDGAITLSYQGLFSRDHLDWKGDPFDKGRVSSNTLLIGMEYGLTDLLTVDAKVALVANKHEGTDRLHGPLDTGIYHGTIQDARIAMAFRVPTGGSVAVAPYVAGVLPTHNYETRGHSAPGRRLRSLQLGAWVGRDLAPLLPKAYVEGQYGYAFVERVGGMSINRSNVDLEGGYALSSRITVRLAGAVQRTHGGLLFPLPRDEHFDEVFPFHDRVARDNYFLMATGPTVAVTPAMSLFASVVRTISGQNTHRVKGILVGASWTFGGGLNLGAESKPASNSQAPNVLAGAAGRRPLM